MVSTKSLNNITHWNLKKDFTSLDELTWRRYLPDPADRTDYCRTYTPPHSVAAPLKHTNTLYMYTHNSCFIHGMILSLLNQKSTFNIMHGLALFKIHVVPQTCMIEWYMYFWLKILTCVVLSTGYLDSWVVRPAHFQLGGREAAGLGVICLLVR